MLTSPIACFVFQSEKVVLERECKAKDEQLAVREVEVEQIPVMRNELKKLRVRISERSIDCSEAPSVPHFSLSHYRQREVVWRRYVKGKMRRWL